MNRILILLFICLPAFLGASSNYPRNWNIDVIHYTFTIKLNDDTYQIEGNTVIKVKLMKGEPSLILDLVNQNNDGKGMKVTSVKENGSLLEYEHKNNRLTINVPADKTEDTVHDIEISYSGIPINGLVIRKNKFGDRTFFGDNYPDRARHWLPCVDHPSDKATLDWIVTAPNYYQVVGNGLRVEETNLNDNLKLSHWRESVPISTKVMVIGVARFAVQYVANVKGTSVESWVYPQNKTEGFHDYAIAVNVLDYYINHLGTYPYEKLANVQSTTMYGACENASNIFYSEYSINGKGENERLIAHEIAHQWFGNSATEKDWPHAWLSEGFATYLTHLYWEYKNGREHLVKGMLSDRARVINYFHRNPLPVVDTGLVSFPVIENLRELLSPNTYQKGGWVLHMLRNKLGDELFWHGLKEYYSTYRDSIVLTSDFMNVIEDVSGEQLEKFFEQWLYNKGHPELAGTWIFDDNKNEITITLTQNQDNLFFVPVEFGIFSEGDEMITLRAKLNSRSQSFTFSTNDTPEKIVIDPNTWLLYEGDSVLIRKVSAVKEIF